MATYDLHLGPYSCIHGLSVAGLVYARIPLSWKPSASRGHALVSFGIALLARFLAFHTFVLSGVSQLR